MRAGLTFLTARGHDLSAQPTYTSLTMGYIQTKPVEEVIRKLFRQKDTVTFWEMVEAGFPPKGGLSYSDAVAMGKGDREGRLEQYELALDISLRGYSNLGFVYPAQWRDILDEYVKFDPQGRVEMAIRRALEGWTTPTPPWLDQPNVLQKTADFWECHTVLVERALPEDENANEARKVAWKVGKSLFDAPYIGGVDL